MPIQYVCDRCENQIHIYCIITITETNTKPLEIMLCPGCKKDLKKFLDTKITRTVQRGDQKIL